MDIWSTGPFDNEEAQEVLEDLKEGNLFIDELLPDSGHRFIEEDHGAMIIALAHLAAGETPETMAEDEVGVVVEKLRTPALKARLRDALQAVLIDGTVSGLYARWEESGEKLHEWKARSFVSL